MNINVKTTNLEISEAISNYLSKRLKSADKFLTGIDPNSVRADVELGRTTNHHKSGDIFRAEINFAVGGDSYRAVSEKKDIYSAIDDARTELVRELRRNKRKRISALHRGGQKVKNIIKGFWRSKENE